MIGNLRFSLGWFEGDNGFNGEFLVARRNLENEGDPISGCGMRFQTHKHEVIASGFENNLPAGRHFNRRNGFQCRPTGAG